MLKKNRLLLSFSPKENRFLFFVIGVILVSSFLGLGYLVNGLFNKEVNHESARDNTSLGATFQNELKNLDDAVDELSTILQTNRFYHEIDDIKHHLSAYTATLLKAKESCERVIKQYSQLPDAIPNELADSASNSRSLCIDVDAVTSYANDVSEGLAPYMFFELGENPGQEKLDKLSLVSQESIDYLKNIDSQGVEDPGINEIIVQLENTKKLASNVDNDDTPYTNLISNQVDTDKQNFMNARSYFWHNTVMLERLQRSIQRIRSEF